MLRGKGYVFFQRAVNRILGASEFECMEARMIHVYSYTSKGILNGKESAFEKNPPLRASTSQKSPHTKTASAGRQNMTRRWKLPSPMLEGLRSFYFARDVLQQRGELFWLLCVLERTRLRMSGAVQTRTIQERLCRPGVVKPGDSTRSIWSSVQVFKESVQRAPRP